MKMFKVEMHHNTVKELLNRGESKAKLIRFEFNTIQEALSFNYPFHKDNYIIIQEDRNSPPNEDGSFDILAEAYLWELKGDEINLEDFIEY